MGIGGEVAAGLRAVVVFHKGDGRSVHNRIVLYDSLGESPQTVQGLRNDFSGNPQVVADGALHQLYNEGELLFHPVNIVLGPVVGFILDDIPHPVIRQQGTHTQGNDGHSHHQESLNGRQVL